MEFTLDNHTGTSPLTLLFGLPVEGERRDFANGAYQGFAFGKTNFLAIPAGSGELLDDSAANALNPRLSGSLFSIIAAPGETKRLHVIAASYDDLPTSGSLVARYYYTSLFPSVDEVITYAGKTFSEAKARCEALNHDLESSGQNVYRQFLAAHALHSYLYNTMLLIDSANKPVFCEQEGQGAALAKTQALRAAATITNHWDQEERFVPAIFDGQNKSRIIPAVEGLVYPQQMGLSDAVSMDGPYGPMIRILASIDPNDPLTAKLSWNADSNTTGCNIHWGIAADKLYESWLVYGQTELSLPYLNAGQAYWIRVDAFNENGVTIGKVMRVSSR
jgi:hypothetical protein